MAQKFYNDEVASSWPEDHDIHPHDSTLREAGFVIHARPRDGRDLWQRGEKTYTVSEAHKIATNEERERVAKIKANAKKG